MLQRAVTTSPVLLAVKVPRPWQGPCIRTWRLRCGWCTGQDNGSRAARGERHAARGHRRRWCVPCISQHGLPHVRLPHFLLPVCTVPRHLTFVFVCGTRSGARPRVCALSFFFCHGEGVGGGRPTADPPTDMSRSSDHLDSRKGSLRDVFATTTGRAFGVAPPEDADVLIHADLGHSIGASDKSGAELELQECKDAADLYPAFAPVPAATRRLSDGAIEVSEFRVESSHESSSIPRDRSGANNPPLEGSFDSSPDTVVSVPRALEMKDTGNEGLVEKEDWDNRTGLIAKMAAWSYNHYYLNLALFLVATLTLSGVIFTPGLADEKCAKGQAQFTVCEESSHDWELSYGNPSKFKDALKGARNAGLSKFKALTGRGASSEVPPRTQQSDLEGVTFVFAHDDIEKYKDTSIFTPARVQAMCRAEAIVTKHPLYPLFCRVDKAGGCVDQIYSPMRFFYPIDARDPASNGCSLLPQKDVDKGMADLLAGALGVGGFFLSDAAVADQKTNKTRANLLLGTPLPGFKDQDDDKDVQQDLYSLFYMGLDCQQFEADLKDKFKRYKGDNPCQGKAAGYRCAGVEPDVVY